MEAVPGPRGALLVVRNTFVVVLDDKYDVNSGLQAVEERRCSQAAADFDANF